jgi:hypothetical protein
MTSTCQKSEAWNAQRKLAIAQVRGFASIAAALRDKQLTQVEMVL